MIEQSNTTQKRALRKTYGCSDMYQVDVSPLLMKSKKFQRSWAFQASTPSPPVSPSPLYRLLNEAGRGSPPEDRLEPPEARLELADDPPDPPLGVECLAGARAAWSLTAAPALLA